MGGAVRVSSTKGQGSTFWLELQGAVPAAAAGPHVPSGPSCASLSVLVVDDDAVNGLVARTLLDKLGHHATVRRSGRTALSALAKRPFDVVLLDIMMPGEDGMAVARRIRQLDGERGRIPLLATTAKLMPESVEGYKAAGIDGVLPKPIILEQLRAAMAAVAPSAKPALARMRADIGERRYLQIVAQSQKSLDAAQRQVAHYAAGGAAKSLSDLLHKLAPTASLLGFAALAQEATSLDKELAKPGAGRADTAKLSSLIAAAVAELSDAFPMERPAHARPLVHEEAMSKASNRRQRRA